MGVSVRVHGVRKKDGKWDKMAKIKQACDEADIGYPAEVEEYFEWPNESLEVNWMEMQECSLRQFGKGDPEYGEGFIIRMEDIPEDVEAIKVSMG